MKKALKIVGIILGSIIGLLLLAALFISIRGVPKYEPTKLSLEVESTPERVQQGLKLASMLCMHCHRGENGKLSGQKIADMPPQFGVSYSSNITQHPETGIGKWTDGEIVSFLRTGVKPDGTFAPFMPRIALMADEDLYSIIAFLRSDHPTVQAVDKKTAPNEYTFFTKFLAQFAFKPAPMPTAVITAPDTNDMVALGKYVVQGQMSCYACHSKDFATVNEVEPEKSEGYLGGGNALLDLDGNTVISANLTMDKETGLGKWTEEQFFNAVKWGQRREGGSYTYPMNPYNGLTDREVKAIWAYLKTVPVLKKPETRNSKLETQN